MNNDIKKLKELFHKIKKVGWIKSETNNLGSIGNTFEKLLGIDSNELEIPDFNQIEIKTKTKYSNSYTTLFNCTPTGPHYHEVERLKENYGYPDSIFKAYKVLNVSIYSGYKKKVGTNFFFELKINKDKQKIYLLIYDNNKKLIENNVFWDFDILKEKLYRKLKYLAFIKAEKMEENNEKYFKYYFMKIYKLKDFSTFIELLEKGIIRISIKVGVFRDKKRIGKTHDHGTSFSIQEKDLNKLYDLIDSCY